MSRTVCEEGDALEEQKSIEHPTLEVSIYQILAGDNISILKTKHEQTVGQFRAL